MESKIRYQFSETIWKHEGTGGWYFVSLPIKLSKEIREHFKWQEQGWGRMKAKVQLKGLEWQTAIWFDTKRDTYLLPIKAEVRRKTDVGINEWIDLILWI